MRRFLFASALCDVLTGLVAAFGGFPKIATWFFVFAVLTALASQFVEDDGEGAA